jgi:hypothetical protein
MLLLEGCSQLSLIAAARATKLPQRKLAVSAYDVNFVQFVECNVPVTLTAQVETAANNFGGLLPLAVHISISQHGVVSGTATMSIAFPV